MSTEPTVGIFTKLQLSKVHFQGVEEQQFSNDWVPFPKDELAGFERLWSPNDTRQDSYLLTNS